MRPLNLFDRRYLESTRKQQIVLGAVIALLCLTLWHADPVNSGSPARSASSTGTPAIVSSQTSTVSFEFDESRVKNILVNGQSLLGPSVATGGIYLIGSLDGSDAQGKSVISIGGTNGYMHSDNPAIVPSPPYRLSFAKAGANQLRFTATVGPVPADFATMSMPFDFGKQLINSFAFAGARYVLQCTENDGTRIGSAATYSSMRPRCEIRNVNGTLIGKVGVATTRQPTTWGEVIGPLATVRVNILSSSHYRAMLFYNHPGTNNLELGFGEMRAGEKATVQGEIIVTPTSSSAQALTFQAENLFHQIGRPDADGWSVNVSDVPGRFMSYGPYTTAVGAGNRSATFRLLLDNVSADNNLIITIDVFDTTSSTILASRAIRRRDFTHALSYQDFSLSFKETAGHMLEFRTFWHGSSYARQDKVVVQ